MSEGLGSPGNVVSRRFIYRGGGSRLKRFSAPGTVTVANNSS